MSRLNFETFIGIPEDDGAFQSIERLIKDFSISLSKKYRCNTDEFEKISEGKRIEYVFHFVSYEEGDEKKKYYRLSLPSDGLSNRFKGALPKNSDYDINEEKIKKSFERCEEYLQEAGVNFEDETAKLPVQNKGEAVFLKQMFFIRLLSDWLKTRPEHLKDIGLHIDNKHDKLVDINNIDADMYLLGIVFYHQEKKVNKSRKTNEDYINFIFQNEKSSKKRLESFENISPDVAEKISEQSYSQLIDVLKSHPLLSYYLIWVDNEAKMEDKRKDLLLLLRQCLRYQGSGDSQLNNEKGFYLVPVVDEVIISKRQRIRELILDEEFSTYAYYDFLGKIAEKASRQTNKHAVSIQYVYELFNNDKEFKECKYDKKLKELLENKKDSGSDEDPSSPNYGKILLEFPWFKEFIKLEDGMFRFKDKISRLFFTANYISMDYNEFWLFDRLLDCCENNMEMEEDSLTKISSRFDSLILLSTMVLHLMPWSDSRKFLYYLATEQASLYEGKNRYKQIAAIAIISYSGLWETHLINNKFRKKLLTAAYGYKRYEFQYDQIDSILKQPFYKKTIKEHFEKMRRKPAETQPLYFFLYHYEQIVDQFISDKEAESSVFDDSTLHNCFWYRDKAWRNDFTSIEETHDFEEFLRGTLEKALKFVVKLTPHRNKEYVTVIQLYAVQSLLFAVANYSDKYSLDFLNQNEKITLLKVAVYCDYFTRKYNHLYNKIYTGETVTQEEMKRLFLLCGPCRVSCVGEYKNIEIKISAEMQKDYKTWLDHEKGRYKILLMRLLAYTNFYNNKENQYTGVDIPNINGGNFLKYDNVDIEKIYQSKRARNELIAPLTWYKKL